ncbi:MAG: hypothetical protein V3S69_03945, partial [Dehalococcoidales bacterium]
MNLAKLIARAEELKPAPTEKCNNCGWCCLSEVCPVGVEHGGTTIIPCKFIATCRDKHYCSLVIEGVIS